MSNEVDKTVTKPICDHSTLCNCGQCGPFRCQQCPNTVNECPGWCQPCLDKAKSDSFKGFRGKWLPIPHRGKVDDK